MLVPTERKNCVFNSKNAWKNRGTCPDDCTACPIFNPPPQSRVNQKKGLCSFSSATVVNAPWTGQANVSGGNDKACSRTFCSANP